MQRMPQKIQQRPATKLHQKLAQELAEDLASLLVTSAYQIKQEKKSLLHSDIPPPPPAVHHPEEPRRKPPPQRPCIICVGSTGTGKSSTIRKVTRRAVSSGNGRDRVTVSISYQCRFPEVRDIVWVDTVGLDDADLEDDSTFKDILRFINDNSLFNVKAILWTVAPNVRRDALLTKQARLIDLFRPGDIWHNVIVACKQSRNPDDDTQGALAAARHHNPHAEPVVLGYTFIDDPSLTSKQRKRFEDPEIRDVFLVKTDEEVRTTIFNAVSSIKTPIKVVFQNHKCIDCSATGDVRLMPSTCHMEPVFVHPGTLVQYHPKPLEKFHDSATVVREHPKGLYRPWYSMNFVVCNCGGERHLCCHALANQPGCTNMRSCCKRVYVEGDDSMSGCRERYQCCKIALSSRVAGCRSRYDCCNLRANSKGCRKVCKKCDKAWGTSAPGCFEKPHNVIELTSKEAEIEDGRMPHKDQPYQKII